MKEFLQKISSVWLSPMKLLGTFLTILLFCAPMNVAAGYKILFYYTTADLGGLSPTLLKAVTVLRNAGDTVTTINTGAAAPYDPTNDDWSCGSYDQIWDMRFDSTQTGCGVPGSTTSIAYFSTQWQNKVTTLLNNCGNFMAEADNAAFSGRDGGFTAFLKNIGATSAAWSAGCAGASDNDSGAAATAYPSTLPGAANFFTDYPGGIPLSVLNGTSYAHENSNWSSVQADRSLAQSWTGAQLSGLTSPVCQRGKLFMEWDMSMWLYNNYEGNAAAQAETQAFFVAIANYLGNCGQCSCGTTNTMTSTNTQTSTLTSTPTNTVTNTQTATNTVTNTQTATVTKTQTNTVTASPTNTETNSQTPTNTQTNTSTVSPTNTETSTNTVTNTQTNTQTNTETIQNTNTETVTETSTDTLADTATMTNTVTVTNTETPTNTITSTQTATSTISSTSTSTSTSTATLANSATMTSTNTVSSTQTNSQTATSTNTIAPTNTQTMTSTPTSGISMCKSVNETQVHAGDTLTYTIGVTVVGNNVNNVVVTDTLPAYMNFMSFGTPPAGTVTVFNSNTDKIQWTLPSPLAPGIYSLTYSTQPASIAPANVALVNGAQLNASGVNPINCSVPVTIIGSFTVNVNIYNSAGEVVKTFHVQSFTQPVNNISLSTTNTITTLQGPGSSIEIIFNGIVIGVWDGTNNAGQPVSNGNYRVQIDNVGQSGVVTSVSQNATVNRSLANITANVYNAAGELVRTLYYLIDDPVGANMTNVTLSSHILQPSLSTNNTSSGSPNLTTVYIQTSGTPVTLVWDGSNNSGSVVSPGEYTLEVHWNDGSGQTTDISRTILVVPSASITGKVLAEPNELPQQGSWTTTFDGSQVASNAAGLKVRVYTIAGELIFSQQSSSAQLQWNANGYASGIYIANVEVDNAVGGVISRQMVKVLVMH